MMPKQQPEVRPLIPGSETAVKAGMTTHKGSVLADWKGIAEYLGKGVRTVQRWEADFGLPVRRTHGSGHKAGVMAVPGEIDTWLQTREAGGRSHESERFLCLIRRVEELQLDNQDLRRQLEWERAQRSGSGARMDTGKCISSIAGASVPQESNHWMFRPPEVIPTAAEQAAGTLLISFSDGTSKSYPPETLQADSGSAR